MLCSKTEWLHFGHLPKGVCPLKSTSSALSSSSLPKSNFISSSSLSLILALNNRPILLRKPVNGPTSRWVIKVSISSISNCRPARIFQRANSHDWHWNFLYVSWITPPHFGQGDLSVEKSPPIVSPRLFFACSTIWRVISAIFSINSLRLSLPCSICFNLNSRSPVNSGEISSGIFNPLNSVMREKALAVGCSSRPKRWI